MPASKLASTIVLALIEEKSTPLNFLYFSTQLSLKILAKQRKTAKMVKGKKVGDLLYRLRVCDDNINQDMTCLITLF